MTEDQAQRQADSGEAANARDLFRAAEDAIEVALRLQPGLAPSVTIFFQDPDAALHFQLCVWRAIEGDVSEDD